MVKLSNTKAAFDNEKVQIFQGDAWDLALELPENSIDCIVTSPPYWALRDYGDEGQFGLEPTPEEYVEKLVELFRRLKPALKDTGTVWLNIGDCYAGTGDKGDYTDPKYSNGRNGQSVAINGKIDGMKSKDMVGIPWMLAFALRADGWYLRSDIIWEKPNCMPSSCKDRPTSSYEHIFLLTKKNKYFYDYMAIAEDARTDATGTKRNKRDVWHVNTEQFSAAHYAVFPPELILPCIMAGSSEKGVCPTCGNPHVRLVQSESDWEERKAAGEPMRHGLTGAASHGAGGFKGIHAKQESWEPTCEHSNEPVPAVVLDPFMGSGTTLQVAQNLGRHAVGFELSKRYVDIAIEYRLRQTTIF